MYTIYTPFWAKKQEDAGRYLWLPLGQHLEDTRAVCGLLWEHWLCRAQRDIVINSLVIEENSQNATQEYLPPKSKPEIAKRLAQFIASVHDIGKACPAFQCMRRIPGQKDLDSLLMEKLEFAGFNGVADFKLSSASSTHHSVAGHVLFKSYGVNDDICSIISSHHGRTVDSIHDINIQLKAYRDNYYQSENPSDSIYKKWDDSQREYFNRALEINGFDVVADLPGIKQSGQVILAGLLIMADWLASNTRYFPLIPIDYNLIIDQQTRLERAWRNWHKKYSIWEAHAVDHAPSLYEERFKFPPRDIQEKAANIIDSAADPGIVIMEAPMGSGKTEAALVLAEILANKCGCCGVFFGLPTQATSNGIFPRLAGWVEELAKEDKDKKPIRLVHGKAALNEEFSALAASSDENPQTDLDGDSRLFVNSWFSGRKTANLDDFVIGTVDQFLLLALKQRHLQLRHLGFSRKVVIIDEVHAYDAYMSQYLYRAITWMGAYSVPVIILSATLPKQKRKELIMAYMLGAGYDIRKGVEYPDGDIDVNNYPLITYNDGNQVRQRRSFAVGKNTAVRIIPLAEDGFIPLLEDFMQSDGIIGIIVNTVRRAQDFAMQCAKRFGDDVVELLHSGFIANERIKKERQLLDNIGKGAKRPAQKIIIGTQVIEQSLDIDFDVLISDLVPMDLLIQRIGRLHRHDILRPNRHKQPVTYVMGINSNLDFEAGSAAVYSPYILARTQHYLPDVINLPGDISNLVQYVYDDEDIDFGSGEINAKYENMHTKHNTQIENKESRAKTFRIEKPALKKGRRPGVGTLVGWLKNPEPIETEAGAFAQVRDSNESIEVIALKKVGDKGYGLFDKPKDISHNICDSSTAKEMAQHTIKLPSAISRPYIIDKTLDALEKYNRENLCDWQEQTWLKGALGIIFDENDEFIINECRLKYSTKYGLSYEFLRGENG